MIKYPALIVLALFFSSAVIAQKRNALRDVIPVMEEEYPYLKKTFGPHKIMPPEFEKQILMALSYYPELKNTKIYFRLRKGNSGILATRPTWQSVLRGSKKRSYVVFIGDSSGKRMPRFLFRRSPVNGQVGIMGHELTHIYNFSRKNSFGLLGIGIAHLSKRSMDQFENKTDSFCIERGLGYQLIDWNIYLRTALGMADPENGPDPFFNDPTRERYMSPARIRQVMARSKLYKH